MKQERTLSLIHILLSLLLPVILSLFIGCREDELGDPVDYGPEENPNAIAEALNEPFSKVNPFGMQPGEFVHFSESQELAAGTAKNILSDTGITITGRTETAELVVYKAIEHKYYYDSNGPRKVSTEKELFAEKNPSASSLSTQETSFADLRMMMSPVKMLSTIMTKKARVTYHRFSKSFQRVPPPEKVQKRENCGGLPGCMLDLYKIEFDEVVWTEGEPEKRRYEFAISPSVPYLAHMMSNCVTLLVPYGGTRILLKQCSPIEDFLFAPATP